MMGTHPPDNQKNNVWLKRILYGSYVHKSTFCGCWCCRGSWGNHLRVFQGHYILPWKQWAPRILSFSHALLLSMLKVETLLRLWHVLWACRAFHINKPFNVYRTWMNICPMIRYILGVDIFQGLENPSNNHQWSLDSNWGQSQWSGNLHLPCKY